MLQALLDPKIDFVFKQIFGSTKHPRVLISFLNAILKPVFPIAEVEIKNTDIEKNKVLFEIAQILLSCCVVSDAKVPADSFAFTGHAKKIMEYVCENYTQKLSLQTIADAVGLSPQYLSKYFKNATNMGLLQYINLIRLEHANKYLVNSHVTITDAALSSGFSNVKTYVQTCKQVYGMTPSAYRKAVHNG